MKFLLEPTTLMFASAAIVSGGLLLWPSIARRSGARALSSLEVTQLINQRNAIVLDVRSSEDFAAGSITGARSTPSDVLAARLGELQRFKNRPMVVVCASGQSSAKALSQLTTSGFTEVYNLAGGVRSWTEAGLPLVKPTTKEGIAQAAKKEKS